MFPVRRIFGIAMRFWRDQHGEDVAEYSLLLGFIFLVSLCMWYSDAAAMKSIWNSANTVMTQGSDAAGASRASSK